jgi:hypothetical protein
LRFRAGDGQTEWFNVDVADRPEIDAIKLTVTPPAYTRQPAKTFDKLPERLSAMKGSRIEVAVHAKSAVETAQLKMDNNKVTLPLGSDGWYRWTTTLGESCSITPVLTEQHGLTNRRQPKCQLIMYEDQPPVVKVLTPNDRMAVRPDDSIQITFSATDDVGIGSAELVVYQEGDQKEPTQLAAIPIDLGEQQGARAVQQTVDLDLKKFVTKNGAELSYEIRVREDRGTDPPRIATRPSTSEKGTKQQPALAARDIDKNKSGKQPQAKASAPANSVAAASAANQASPSNAQNSQTAPSASAENTAKQAPTTSPNQAAPAKPDAGALAKNENTKPSQSPENERSQPTAQTAAVSPTQPAASNSAPDNKDAAAERARMAQPASPQPKNSAEPPTPRTASGVPQTVAKPADEQSTKPQSANASPPANPSAARAATATAKQQPANPQQPANSAAQMATNETPKPAASQSKNPAESPEARTASSGRQSLAADNNPANGSQQPAESQQASSPQNANSGAAKNAAMKQDQTADQKPATSNTAKAGKDEPNSDKSMASAKQGQLPSSSNAPPNDPSKTASSQSTPSPGDNMPKRMLDVVPQSSSSQRMRLKVDQFAGSFEGQQRAKLEMAISPELEALDQKLAKAQRTTRGVLDGLEADHSWLAAYDRDLASTQQLVADGKGIIDKLVKQSKDTPYAFIGLQLADLDVAHLEPARADFFSAIQSKGDDRTGSVRDGWQHLGRARQLLADLRGQFERSKRDFQLAEAVEHAKKMYQVYVENSQALLEMHDTDPDRYNRKLAEFNLDDEYLKRLKEVIKMRTDLEAELARILGDDPRLLRRYMDNLRARSNNLREQLADLSARQEGLNREVRAWAAFAEADRQPMARLLLLQNLQESSRLATSAGDLQDRYQSWLPLQKESKDSSLVAVSKQIQAVATSAGELKSRAENYIATEQQAAAAPPAPAPASAPAADATAASAKPQAAADNGQALDQIIAQSESLYGQLGQLEVSLRQVASREDQPDIAVFAGNRLVQARQLIADSTAWIRQIKAHKAGSYTGAAEVTQYRLAMKTDELAGKLGNLEQQLAGALQRPDRSLPEPIANKAREFMAALDKEAAPNQLAAVYALHSNQPPRATERQQLAGAALVKAEKLYDELMKLAITELDKLPVQDPIASLLEDPTLDELLAQLEQELPLQELLGIPNRPSNLRIIGDWMKPGNGGGGGMRQIAMNQMRQQDKRSQEKLKKAYQQAIARALKETTPKRTEKVAKSTKLSDWNKLVSHLGDDLKQGRDKAPPEQYRQAIEQYFAQISRAVAEQEKKSP